MDVAQTETLIREKLENTGQLNKMRAMVIDASLRAIAGSAADADELFTVSPNMIRMKKEDPEGLKRLLSVIVEGLNYLGLAYSANVVSVETGVKPVEIVKKDALAGTLGLSAAPGSVSLIQQLIAGGGGGNASSAANNNNNTNNINATSTSVVSSNNLSGAGMASFGSADITGGASSSSIASKPTTTAPPAAAAAAAPTVSAAVTPASINPDDFEDTSAPKPHRMSENSRYIVSRWSHRNFKRHNQIRGQPMNIDQLEDCRIVVLDDMDSTNIDDCKNTIFIFAAVSNSIFLRTCENCVVYAACKQFRVRDCVDCEVHLFAGTDPVVETSTNILFKPFNLRLPQLKLAFKNAGLDPAVNRYIHVYDFNEGDTKYPEPHFVVKHENHGLEMEDMCSEDGDPECPEEIEMLLDGRLQPAASVESGQNKSLNIKTGAGAWTGDNSTVSNGAAAAAAAGNSSGVAITKGPAAAAAAPASDPASSPASSEAGDQYSDYESSSPKSSKYSHSEDDDEF